MGERCKPSPERGLEQSQPKSNLVHCMFKISHLVATIFFYYFKS